MSWHTTEMGDCGRLHPAVRSCWDTLGTEIPGAFISILHPWNGWKRYDPSCVQVAQWECELVLQCFATAAV